MTHALCAVTHHLDRLGRHGLELRLGERPGIELQFRPDRGDQIPEHRRAHHPGEDLQRTLAPVRLAPPAIVQHRELRLVPGREGHAVQQLAPQHPQRLPVLFHFDQRPVAHGAGTVAGRAQNIRYRRAGGRSERDEPLEVQDMARHLGLLCSTGRRRRGTRELAGRSFPRRTDGGRQLAWRGQRRRLLAQRRRRQLDGILAPQAHPQPQRRRVAPRDRDDAVRVAHPMAFGVAGLIEHGHGHALRGLARVLMHDPKQPNLGRHLRGTNM